MRHSRQEAAETRTRIVATASRQFRAKGVHATGLAEVMEQAGLTHGGFYRHFVSKDQLVAEALDVAWTEGMTEMGTDTLDPAAFIARYLSPQHRDNASRGCPLAALGSELARADDATRHAAMNGFAALAGRVAGGEVEDRHLAIASLLVGAVTMARIAQDPAASASILRAALDAATRL